MSDDYYAGLLPLPFKGRELYLPQLGVGRLVESPAEIATQIDTFLGLPADRQRRLARWSPATRS